MLRRGAESIGLDIGSHAVKLVAMRRQRGDDPYRLTRFGVAQLPRGAIVEGAVVGAGEVTQVIRDLLRSQQVKAGRVATAVSGDAVIVRRVTMPRIDADELRASIAWEAEEYIPVDIDEVNVDFAILDEGDAAAEMEVVLVAARRDRIDPLVALIESAGGHPAVVDIGAFALQNAFELSYPERQHEHVALVDVGASVITIAVLGAGRPSFWRHVSPGARRYGDALQREFALDDRDVDELLRSAGGDVDRAASDRHGVNGDDDAAGRHAVAAEGDTSREQTVHGDDESDHSDAARVRELVGEVSERLIAEVEETLAGYRAQSESGRLEAIFLAGGGAHIAALAPRLERRLGIAVERFEPLRRVSVPKSAFDPEYVRGMGPQAAVAVGLALRGDGRRGRGTMR